MDSKYARVLAIVLIVVFILLLIPFESQMRRTPYFLDEAYSVYLARMPWLKLEQTLVSGAEAHPPLYSNVLKLWMTFSVSYTWIRLFSSLMVLLTLIVIYKTCIENFDGKIAVVAIVVTATSSFSIWAGSHVRMYAFFLFLTSLSIYYFFRLLKKPDAKTKWLYILSSTAGMYNHWFFIYVLFSQILFLMLKREVKLLMATFLPICLLCVPLVPLLLSEIDVLSQTGGFTWSGKIDMNKLIGLATEISTTAISGILFLVVIVVGLQSSRIKMPRQIQFCLILMSATILLSIVIDRILEWNFFVDRYFIFLVIPVSITVSYFTVKSHMKVIAILLALAVAYNFYTIALDKYVLLTSTSKLNETEMEENARYDLILHMSMFTYLPSVAYDWDSKDKHKLIYDSNLEKNQPIEGALKTGLIENSTILHSCDELKGKKVILRESDNQATVKSTEALKNNCFGKKKIIYT